jgi:hypothetical protein
LLLLHVAGAVLLTIAVAGPARAQSTGIAACDDFLQKYDTCVTSKLPEAQRATYKAQLDQTRKMWLDMAKNPSAKSTMEGTCKQTTDAMKARAERRAVSIGPSLSARGDHAQTTR